MNISRILSFSPLQPFKFQGASPVDSQEKDVFCKILDQELPGPIIVENRHAFALLDKFPISEGHMVVMPKRHIITLFEATEAEMLDIYRLLQICKQKLELAYREKGMPVPNAYNIAVNSGKDSGYSVPHLHIHLIPRYPNDVRNPLGGIVKGDRPQRDQESELTSEELLSVPL